MVNIKNGIEKQTEAENETAKKKKDVSQLIDDFSRVGIFSDR